MAAGSAHVRDVDERTFETEVIARSFDTPVVVDFWAAWCGPCRMLGPVLGRLASESGGAWQLVKVDTDRNQQLATRYGIQGIPAVKAFRNGQVVNEFTGALPEPSVRAWLTSVIPSRADQFADEGRRMLERGDQAAAEQAFRQALREQPGHVAAAIGLASTIAAQHPDEAEQLLRPHATTLEAQAVLTLLRLRAAARGADLTALRRQVEVEPRSAEAHFRLGMAFAGDEAVTAGLDHLLESVRLDRRWNGDAARKAMLDIFAMLGDDDPRTRDYRGRLSAILF